MPQENLEAECILLGTLLDDNNILDDHYSNISVDYFSCPLHKRTYGYIIDFWQRGLMADPVTLKSTISKDPAFEKTSEGVDYLLSLVASTSKVFDVSLLIKTLSDLYIERELLKLADDIPILVKKEKPEVVLSHTTKALSCIENTQDGGLYPVLLTDVANKTLVNIKDTAMSGRNIVGLSTGLVDIDRDLGGLRNSDLIILAARPAMGKTSLAINMAINICKSEDCAVLFLSLEMSSEQLSQRILSMVSGVEITNIRNGKLTNDMLRDVERACSELSNVNLFFDDRPAITINELKARARKAKRVHNIKAIFIDYLQLMRGDRFENRVQEISEITRGLKAVAKELNMPVVALSQLSRSVEGREDKRPRLSDLRESGSIEQDADIVMFLYRQYYYESEPQNDGDPRYHDKHNSWKEKMEKIYNQAELIISKHRNGATGVRTLFFDPKTTNFSNFKFEKINKV